MSKTDVLISTLKNVWHPTASTCCLCWTIVVGNNSFSNMYVYARCSVLCRRVRYVIKVLILRSWQRCFIMHMQYMCTLYVCNGALCTYVNLCTCMYPHWKLCQPLHGHACAYVQVILRRAKEVVGLPRWQADAFCVFSGQHGWCSLCFVRT